MKHEPERTCIGCRQTRIKGSVVRVVAGPDGILIDYREKLPGRAAYICPRRECIEQALSKEALSRALHAKVRPPNADEFLARLASLIGEKIGSLLSISLKAGKIAAGYSAVSDALEKGSVELLLYAADLSDGTREKVAVHVAASLRQATLLTREEFGRIFNREFVGVVAITDKGLANAIWIEAERLKGLININN